MNEAHQTLSNERERVFKHSQVLGPPVQRHWLQQVAAGLFDDSLKGIVTTNAEHSVLNRVRILLGDVGTEFVGVHSIHRFVVDGVTREEFPQLARHQDARVRAHVRMCVRRRAPSGMGWKRSTPPSGRLVLGGAELGEGEGAASTVWLMVTASLGLLLKGRRHAAFPVLDCDCRPRRSARLYGL